jgi:16S rRNA (cytosine967-C5)-methyltransferase
VLNDLDRRSRHPEYSLERAAQEDTAGSERDRAFALHLVQGVLRWRLRLDWIIQQGLRFPFRNIRPDVLNVLRLAVYQIFFMDRVPDSAAVNEAVGQVKGIAANHVVRSVNGILRQVCREKMDICCPGRSPDVIHYLSVCHSYPEWLVRRWVEEMGEESTEELLAAGNRIPSLVVRTNTLKLARAELIVLLQREGIAAKPTNFAPEGLVLEGLKGPVGRSSALRSGYFQVQGEAAQVCSHLLSPESGETVLDVCTGVGGKSTHMAQLMRDRGLIVGIDRNHRKLLKLVESSLRLGIHVIEPLAGDAEQGLSRLLRCSFDRIMVDGPCSALGVISRHPDVKWNREEGDLLRLGKLQQRILDEACLLLRPGGKMLYATCTLSREENEDVAEAFLRGHREMKLVDLRKRAPAWARDLVNDQGFLKCFPHLHGTDGFFGGVFEKLN